MQSKTTTTRDAPLEQSDSVIARDQPILWLRATYVGFLQGLFKHLPKGQYRWESGENTEIYISDETPVKTTLIGFRPAIAVTRSPIMMSNLGMDDMASYDMQTGAKTKVTIIPGNMFLNCVSRVPPETETIAMFAAENLWMLRDILQKTGVFFDVGRNYSIGAPSPAGAIIQGDNADDYYVTAVTCPFRMIRKGSVTPLGQYVANEIALQMQMQKKIGASESVPSYSFPVISTAAIPEASVTGQQVTQAQDVVVAPGVGVQLNPPSIKGRRIR